MKNRILYFGVVAMIQTKNGENGDNSGWAQKHWNVFNSNTNKVRYKARAIHVSD